MLRSITNALIRAARWIDALWGYDVFIAHRRADAAGYAQTLYDSLQAERISSFIDRVVYGPGDSLLIATRQHVAKSSLFLLLGSPQFLVRREPVDWVEREIETYLASHDDPKIIIVDFGDTIANALLPPAADPQASSLVQPLRPYLRVSQDLSALDHPPAEDVLAAIRRSLHGRSRDRRRLRFFQGIAAALALLLAVAAGLGWFARQQGLAAIDQRNQALINESQALAVQSFQATGSGDATLGALIALEGLPEREQPPHLRPLVGETTEALLTALYALAERTVVSTRDIGSEHPEARLSADGKYLLLRGSTNLVRDVRDGRPLASIKGSYDDIVEFDSDGETVVRTSEFAGVVRVEFWNIQTGALVDELHDDQPFTEAVVSPDGSRIITASDMAGHILIWDAVTRKVLITIPIPVMPPEHKAWHGFVFNFDGSRVAIRRDDTNELTIWDSKNGTQLHSINDKDQGRHGVSALNHDGSRYMIWQFELWNAESGTLETKLKGVSGPMVAARTDAVAFSPDGSLLAVRNDYSVSVFDGNDGSFRFDLTGFSGKIKHLAFGAKGRELVTTSEDGVVRLWNTETGALIAAYGGSDRDLGFAELGLDGQTLAFRDKKAARILDVRRRQPDFVLGGHTAPATMAVSPDNSLLATGSTDHTVQVFDLKSGERRHRFELKERVYFVAFSPDGQRLIAGGEDGAVNVWESPSGRPLFSLPNLGGPVYSARFSPDGKLIAGTSNKGTAVWDSGSGTLKRKLMEPRELDSPITVSFNGDGSRIMTRSPTSQVVWNTVSGAPLFQIVHQTENDPAFAFDQNGKTTHLEPKQANAEFWDKGRIYAPANFRLPDLSSVAYVVDPSGRFDVDLGTPNSVRLSRRGIAGSQYVDFSGHTDIIRAMAVSADGERLATAANDGTVRVWSVTSLRTLGVFAGHDKPVIMAMFTHDGRQLITSAEDNEIRVWNLYSDHQSLLRRVCESLPRDISSEQAIRFLGRRADGEKDDGLLGAGQRPKRCAVLLNAAGK